MDETIVDLVAPEGDELRRRFSAPELAASLEDVRRYGRTLRSRLPRGGHATLTLPERDPIAILEEQNSTRLRELVPVRIGRMLQSPFAFYRGTAAVMAHDLAADRVTGHQVVCCGDAHISNFGLFASPERRVLFDLNDFDEASNGPWEWDVKRLAASVVVGARDNGIAEAECRDVTETVVRTYRTALRELFEMTALERYFFRVETDWLEETAQRDDVRLLRRTVRKARNRTSDRMLDKLTVTTEGGGRRIKDVPPITQHVDHVRVDELAGVFEQYRGTLRADTALLLSQFSLADYVLRVVGVGSVGTRCYVLLLVGPSGEPLFLQAKEAPPSVLETYGGHRAQFERVAPVDRGHQGYRVVSGQRILQAQSDPFLGWIGTWAAERDDRPPIDFYVRQFRDMKGSLDTRGLTTSQYRAYVSLCAGVLARAHSQSPGGAAIAGYLGRADRFDQAVARWSIAYADQAEHDFDALEDAVRTGRLPAEHGV